MSRITILACVACAACGRVGFAPFADGGVVAADSSAGDGAGGPIHRYRFLGNLNDDFGGPPLGALIAGMFTPNGYQFVPNGGLTLPITTGFPSAPYTVDMQFELDDVSSWRKVLDFDGGNL